MDKIKIHRTTPLKTMLEIGRTCDCKGGQCGKCCEHVGAVFLDGEEEKVAKTKNMTAEEFEKKFLEHITRFNTTRKKAKQKENGECIFLAKNGLCTIHEVKPLHCQVCHHGPYGEEAHDWFDVHYFVNTNDPNSLREWNIKLNVKPSKVEGVALKDLIGKKVDEILHYEDLQYQGGKKNE